MYAHKKNFSIPGSLRQRNFHQISHRDIRVPKLMTYGDTYITMPGFFHSLKGFDPFVGVEINRSPFL